MTEDEQAAPQGSQGSAANADRKQRGRPFRPGQSGNPAGKRKGTRHVALLALDAIGEAAAADVLRRVVEDAKGGDLRAAEILLRRLWPERKGRPTPIELPALDTPADLVNATAAIVEAVASGDVTPEEGAAVAAIVETHRRTVETVDLERRLATLEAKRDAG